ncbi:MAG: hypothetical protein ACMG6S_01525 [Byssovorax sp.]
MRRPPATFAFISPNPGWVPALLVGTPVDDPAGDIQGPRDIVGDAANPMLFIASDATHLYLRLRLNGDPTQTPTNFTPFGWGCFIDTDNDTTTYEISTIVDGVANPDQISFFKNTVTATPNSPDDAPDLPAVSIVSAPLTAAIGHARVVSAPSMPGRGNPSRNNRCGQASATKLEPGPSASVVYLTLLQNPSTQSWKPFEG